VFEVGALAAEQLFQLVERLSDLRKAIAAPLSLGL
jgi:hypothetical protein